MNNLCLHNLETQITKINLHIKNIVHIATEQTTPSPLVSKKPRDDEDKRHAYARSKSFKNHLCSSFVLLQMTEQNDMIHVIEVEVIPEIIISTKIILKTDIALHLEIDLFMTKVLLLHNTLNHDMTNTNEIHDHFVFLIDLLTDRLTDTTLVIDKDHAHIRAITTFLQGTHLHIDHLPDQEFIDYLDLVHFQIQETNLIQYNHNTKMTQSTLKCTCITQLKWQML